ncbi:MAG: hypothetical protein ACI9NT_001202, partial [Bacteroidia bacterium]
MHDHLSRQALNAGLPAIQAAPTDQGELRVIVRRPANNERESLS